MHLLQALFEKRGASFLHREDDSVEHFEETRRHREEERLQQLAQVVLRILLEKRVGAGSPRAWF